MPPSPSFICKRIGRANRTSPHPLSLVYLHGSGRTEDDGEGLYKRLNLDCSCLTIRGNYPCENGFTFIRRQQNRAINPGEIAKDAANLANFLKSVQSQGPENPPQPILIGYSSGAILAAALLWCAPSLVSGAILLRPQSPSPASPTNLAGKPVLMLSGKWDARREPADAMILEQQLTEAKAALLHHCLDTGHEEEKNGLDYQLMQDWLKTFQPKE